MKKPSWSTPRDERPTWRGLLHAGAGIVAVPGVAYLIVRASRPSAMVAAIIYGASVVLAFTSSAIYHRVELSERARVVLQRVDHSMIFVLIAGSYTPLCLLALPRRIGVPLLVVAWSGATLGVVLKIWGFRRFTLLGYSLYPILGWVLMFAMPWLYHSLTHVQLALVIAGGLLYTGGIPVLVRGRPNPWPRTFGYHEVWHACTVAAAACHFVTIGMLVR